MSPTVEQLLALVPPPKLPIAAPTSDEWDAFEKRLRSELPEDFRRIVTAYGIGRFASFIWIYSPISYKLHYRLSELMDRFYDVMYDLRTDGHFSTPLYPELNGLLAWATTQNGDTLLWRTHPNIRNWQVVLNPSQSTRFVEFDETTSSFIRNWLTGQLQSNDLPNLNFTVPVDFISFDDTELNRT